MQPILNVRSSVNSSRRKPVPRSIPWACVLAPLTLTIVGGGCTSSEPSAATEATDAGHEADVSLPEANGTTTGNGTSNDELFGGGGAVTVPAPTSDAGDSTNEEDTVDRPPLVSCEIARGGFGNPVIDDFEASTMGDNGYSLPSQDGREATWFTFQDPSGGEQTLTVETTVGPGDTPTRALHTTGSGAFEWGQGFGTGLRWGVDDSGQWIDCWYDASAYEGISFWLRGTGGQVRLKAVTVDVISKREGGRCDEAAGEICWDDHGMDLQVTETWQRHEVAFDALTQAGWGKNVGAFDASEIRLVEFQTGADAVFDIWLDDLSFYPDLRPSLDGGSADAGNINNGGDAELDGGGNAADDGGAMFDGGTSADSAALADAFAGGDANASLTQ